METIEALLTRRSVRKFTNEPVRGDQIEIMLRAAMFAPSACNQQPWHFLVVTERKLLVEIALHHPYAQMLKEAALAVIVCADLSLETCPGNWLIDCSAATENLLLAAHDMGLGGVWVGIHPNQERMSNIVAQFNLPESVKPVALAAIGHPLEPLPVVERFLPERIHRNAW